MINKAEPTLLEQLREAGLGIDVDGCDPKLVASLPFKAQDVTSNQILIHQQILNERSRPIVEGTIKEMNKADWLDIYPVLTARFHKEVISLIDGRVLAQLSPQYANDKQKMVEQARQYAKAYNAEGVSNDRFCIKIPTTTAGVQAAAELYKDSPPIRTLGTSLFSVGQAIAASQANMWSISPYFNGRSYYPRTFLPSLMFVLEVRAHVEEDLWPDVEDPATQHPMANRMIHIRDTYRKLKKTGKTVPLNKAASVITPREVIAMIELGADQVTIQAGCLEDLISTSRLPAYKKGEWQKRLRTKLDDPYIEWSSWTPPPGSDKRMAEMAMSDPMGKVMQKDFKMASTDVDYLEDGVLDDYNEKDEITRVRLRDALEVFLKAEAESKEEILRLQKVLL